MQSIVKPSKISGTIVAAASKSAMQRACAAALIHEGTSFLHNPGKSADDLAALDIIQVLGASIEYSKNELIIESKGVKPVSDIINCGESGLSVRMFTSIAATSDQPITISGKGSLVKRPLAFFNEILPKLNVSCHSNNGLLPIQIKGPLQPKNIEVDGSLSSQFLTGLLLAYAASGANDVTIKVNNLNSRPYIDLTLQVMRDFGLKTPANNNYESFYFDSIVPETGLKKGAINYTVEADWSGGAFLLVAGAIAGEVIVKGLDIHSAQADKAILNALEQAGAIMKIEEKQVKVKSGALKAFHFNATDCPDLFPPLVSLAAFCEGTSVIDGIHRLTHKESNRALTLQQEFGKMGLEINLKDDQMTIKGVNSLKGTFVHSHHDHRIAMACAVAALRSDGQMTIEGAEAVNKSYPDFWDHLQKLSGAVSLNQN